MWVRRRYRVTLCRPALCAAVMAALYYRMRAGCHCAVSAFAHAQLGSKPSNPVPPSGTVLDMGWCGLVVANLCYLSCHCSFWSFIRHIVFLLYVTIFKVFYFSHTCHRSPPRRVGLGLRRSGWEWVEKVCGARQVPECGQRARAVVEAGACRRVWAWWSMCSVPRSRLARGRARGSP